MALNTSYLEAIAWMEKAPALDSALEGVPYALKDARLVLEKKRASLTDSEVTQLRKDALRPSGKKKMEVRFLKKYQQTVSNTFRSRICTYEWYKSESVTVALALLQTKRVSENFYYIEVETPQCLVGKDIKGVDRM